MSAHCEHVAVCRKCGTFLGPTLYAAWLAGSVNAGERADHRQTFDEWLASVRRALPSERNEREDAAPMADRNRHCPDGGKCHHGCADDAVCFRVNHAGPLSDYAKSWRREAPDSPVPDVHAGVGKKAGVVPVVDHLPVGHGLCPKEKEDEDGIT